MRLTGKQARFVAEYVNCLNGTQAAIAAGYSVRTARAIASENLGKRSIREEIANQQAARQERLNATREYLLRKLVKITPVALGVKISEVKLVLKSKMDRRDGTRDLAGNERLPTVPAPRPSL